MITDTNTSVGMSCSSRWPRNVSTVAAPDRPQATRRSFQLQSDNAHQPIRYLFVAVEPRGVRDQSAAVVDVELRIIVENDLGQLLVDRLALRGIGDHARVV